MFRGSGRFGFRFVCLGFWFVGLFGFWFADLGVWFAIFSFWFSVSDSRGFVSDSCILVSDSRGFWFLIRGLLVSDSRILVSDSRVLVSDSLLLIRGKFLIRGLFMFIHKHIQKRCTEIPTSPGDTSRTWPALVHIVVLPGGFHRSGNLGPVVLFVVHLLQRDFHLRWAGDGCVWHPQSDVEDDQLDLQK